MRSSSSQWPRNSSDTGPSIDSCEARAAPSGSEAATKGKVKEPLLRLTQFWRAYDARSNGTAGMSRYGANVNFSGGVSAVFGQGPGQSASVFNFFSPFYAPPGAIADQGLVSPELQLSTEYLNTQVTNYFWTQAANRTQVQAAAANFNPDLMFITTTDELGRVADPEALINRVAEKLLGGAGQMSATLKSEAKAQIERTTPGNISRGRNRPGTTETALCRVIDARPGSFIVDATCGGLPFGFAGQTPGKMGLA